MDFGISLEDKKLLYQFGIKETNLCLPKLLDNLRQLKNKITEELENKNNTREIGTQTD